MLTAHQAASSAVELLQQAASLHERADHDIKQAAALEARGRRDEARLLSRASVANRNRAYELSERARELSA